MNAGDIAAQNLKSRTGNIRADLHQNPFASDNTGLNFFTGNNDDTGYMLDVFTRTPADNALLDFGINPDDIKYNLENHIKEGTVLVNKIKNASSKNQVFQILKQYCPDDNTALQVFNYLMNITAQSNFSDYDAVSNDNPFKDRNKAYLMSALYTVQEGRLKPVYETKGAQRNDFDGMMTAVLPELVYQFNKEGTPDNIRNWCAETFGIGISDKDIMEEIRTAGAASRIYKSLNENNMNKARLLCRAELDTRLQNSKNMREVYDNLALYYGKDNAFKILEKTINAFKDKNGNICVRDEYLKTGHFPYAPYETSAMPVSAVPASKTRFSAAAIEQSDIPGIKNHNLKDKDAVYNFISRGGKNTAANRAEFEKISPLYQKWADIAVKSEEAQRINNAGEFCLNPENKQKINDCIEKYAEFAFQNDEIRSHYAKILNQDKTQVKKEDIAEYIKKPENIAEESKKFMKYAFESSKEKLYGKSNLDGTVQEYCSEMAQWPSNFARRLSLALMAASYLPGAPVSGLMPASMGAQFSDDGIDLWNKLSNGQNYQDNNYEDFLKNVLLKAGIKAGYFALGGMANKAGALFDAKFGKGIEAALNKCGIGGNFFRILAQNTAEAGFETAIGLPYTMMIKAVQGGKYDITAEFIENFIFDGLPYLRGGALFSGKPVIKPDGTKIDFEDSGGGRFRITETKTQWESDKQGGIKPVTTQSSRITALDEQKGKLTVYDGGNPEKVLYSIERDETGAAKLITPAEPAPKIEAVSEISALISRFSSCSIEQVKNSVNEIIRNTGVSEKEAVYALQMLTQFGNMEAAAEFIKMLGKKYGISGFADMDAVCANSALQYLTSDKNQMKFGIGLRSFFGGRKAVILDEFGLQYLEKMKIKNPSEFYELLDNKDIKFIYPEGWNRGINIYSQNTDITSLTLSASDMISKAKAMQASEGISFETALSRVIIEPDMKRIEALEMAEIVQIVSMRNGKHFASKPDIQTVFNNIKPLNITENQINDLAEASGGAFFPGDKVLAERAAKLLKGYIQSELDIYSPQRLGGQLVSIKKNIDLKIAEWKKPDGAPFTHDDVYYVIPNIHKSYTPVMLQYASLNGIDPSHIIYGGANVINYEAGKGGKIFAVLDDCVGSGDSMIEQTGGLLYKNINRKNNAHIIIAPVVSGKTGAQAVKRAIINAGREHLDCLLIADSQIKNPYNETDFYINLSDEDKKLLNQMLADLKSVYGALGHKDGAGYALAFPGMTPDNNSAFITLLLRHVLLNPNALQALKNHYNENEQIVKDIMQRLKHMH